ncbi:MAG TPA: sterol desaturase family protein [Stellaceae bacterium]|nr:sterol desaturase family protein [Stellaceae bacterium]
METLAGQALALLVAPFVQFAFAGSLFWLPYLAIAFAVALAVCWRGQGETPRAFCRKFFSRRVWAHPSAQADYAYYLVNAVLYPVIVAPLIVSGAAIGGTVEAALHRVFGAMAAPLLAPGAARIAYTVMFFLAYDGARYLAHSLLHDVPILWPFHKLHHTAEVLTPFTNFRAHPVELFVMGLVPNLATGLVSGIVWYAEAGAVGFYTFLGLHVFLLPFNALANLRHAELWISFGPVLNRWLISPAHHRIHHSAEARHFGRNRGFALAIWDRMFGTLDLPGEEERFRLGLGDGGDGAWHRVGRMYGWPFRDAAALLRHLSKVEARR